MSTVSAGRLGEKAARAFLKKKGYKILATNFRSRFGEIDIVASHKKVLVFVEVKTRWSEAFGHPEEAVTPWKLKKIVKAGNYYKLTHPNTPDLMQVDVVAVEVRGNIVTSVKLIENATA